MNLFCKYFTLFILLFLLLLSSLIDLHLPSRCYTESADGCGADVLLFYSELLADHKKEKCLIRKKEKIHATSLHI